MKLPEVIERLFKAELRIDELEKNKQPNLNQGLLEAMLRQQMKRTVDPGDALREQFEPKFRD